MNNNNSKIRSSSLVKCAIIVFKLYGNIIKDGDTFDLIRPSDDLTYLNEFEYPLRKDLTLKLIHRYSQFITRQLNFLRNIRSTKKN